MPKTFNPHALKAHWVYTVEALMEALGVSRNTVARWVQAGLKPSRDGNR